MKTSENFFNFVDMLRLQDNAVNKISAQDFTLDELIEFEKFLVTLGKAYNASNIDKLHRNFRDCVSDYEKKIARASMDEIENADWIDEDFFNLKLQVEDMAALLVFDTANGFFSEARR